MLTLRVVRDLHKFGILRRAAQAAHTQMFARCEAAHGTRENPIQTRTAQNYLPVSAIVNQFLH